jgi:hypothetical protein
MDLSRFPLLAQQHSWINSLQNLANRPLGREFEDLKRVIAVAIVLIRPNYAAESTKNSLHELGEEVDALSSIPYDSSIYEFAKTELIQKFNTLTGQKISDTEFILEACFDITYLQLAVLLSKMKEDVRGELQNYKAFKEFSSKPVPDLDEITQEYKNSLHSFYGWAQKTQHKINSWFDETISNK